MRLAVPILAAVAALAALAGAAQAQVQAEAYKAPRTPWGAPDFRGVWTNASLTSLERPPQFKALVASEQQARALEQMRAKMSEAQSRPSDPNAGAPAAGGDPGGYNSFWAATRRNSS